MLPWLCLRKVAYIDRINYCADTLRILRCKHNNFLMAQILVGVQLFELHGIILKSVVPVREDRKSDSHQYYWMINEHQSIVISFASFRHFHYH